MTGMGEIVATGFGVAFLLLLALSYNKRFAHKFLGWHTPRGGCAGFDGMTVISRCELCSLRIGQDSQGNWFAFARQGGPINQHAEENSE